MRAAEYTCIWKPNKTNKLRTAREWEAVWQWWKRHRNSHTHIEMCIICIFSWLQWKKLWCGPIGDAYCYESMNGSGTAKRTHWPQRFLSSWTTTTKNNVTRVCCEERTYQAHACRIRYICMSDRCRFPVHNTIIWLLFRLQMEYMLSLLVLKMRHGVECTRAHNQTHK